MRKIIKKISKLFIYLLLLVLFMPVIIWGMMYIPSVQNFAVHKVLTFVSDKLGTTISYSDVRTTATVFCWFMTIITTHCSMRRRLWQ